MPQAMSELPIDRDRTTFGVVTSVCPVVPTSMFTILGILLGVQFVRTWQCTVVMLIGKVLAVYLINFAAGLQVQRSWPLVSLASLLMEAIRCVGR